MRQRVTVLACVCVCLSVTTLAAASFISTLEIRYEQLYYSILLIFNVWIFIKMLRSEVMASFAYRDSLRRYCSDPKLVFSMTEASKVVSKANGTLNASWNTSQRKAASYFFFQ